MVFFLIFLLFFISSSESLEEKSCSSSSIYSCTKTLPLYQTHRFRCEDSNQCPNNYLCCSDKCFQHKICKTAPDSCPKQKIFCASRVSFFFSQRFLCNSHDDCPDDFLCCFDDCFWHRICKVRENEEGKILTLNGDENQTEETTTANLEAATEDNQQTEASVDSNLILEEETPREEEEETPREEEEELEVETKKPQQLEEKKTSEEQKSEEKIAEKQKSEEETAEEQKSEEKQKSEENDYDADYADE